MPYLIRLTVKDEDNLSYKFKGVAPFSRPLDMSNVVHVRHASLSSCIEYGIRAPDDFVSSAPAEIIIKPNRDGSIPDFGMATQYNTYLVSNKFRDVVESLEPGAHQFIPIRETIAKNARCSTIFYLLNILTILDAIIVDRSSVRWETLPSLESESKIHYLTQAYKSPWGFDKFTLSGSQISKSHIWRGSAHFLGPKTLFISDMLYQTMRQAMLSKLNFIECDVA